MPRASDGRIPATVSDMPPSGAPAIANQIRDPYAGQLEIVIRAEGADVELGAVAGGGRTTYWAYNAGLAAWGTVAPYRPPEGWTIADGDYLADIIRMPRGTLAVHLEFVGALGVGSAVATVQTVRVGV